MRARLAVALALGILPLHPAGAATDDCLVAWRVAGGGGASVACRDGDVGCDADGVVDRACTFGVALCVNLAGCAPAGIPEIRVRGSAAASIMAAVGALGAPAVASDLCTSLVQVRVRTGRSGRLVARARDQAGRRHGRARLRLACRRPVRPSSGRAIVVTTDFETGLLATVGVRGPHPVGHPDTPIHSDALVRVVGERVFVVNRFLGDNLQVLDPARGLTTVLQCSTGPGSNPHDVAVVASDKAYVTRYDEKELWVVNPSARSCDGFLRRTVDLSPYGDGDGIPEMDQMAVVGDRLFVSVERLDRTRRFAPAGRSRIVVLDTASDAVVGVIDLTGADAFGDSSGLVHEPWSGKLVVSEAGDIQRTGDGGLERIDPFTLTAEGFFVTEDDLGGNITDFVLRSPTEAYAIVIDDRLQNILLAFDPSQRVVTKRLLVRTQYLPDIALAPDGTLWVADDGLPAPGIRIFARDDRELTRAAIDVGLPPFSIGFLP
jgi:DNA-binding beta-propeller fold protein YncE